MRAAAHISLIVIVIGAAMAPVSASAHTVTGASTRAVRISDTGRSRKSLQPGMAAVVIGAVR